MVALEMDVDKVDDISQPQPVEEVPQSPSEDEGEGELNPPFPRRLP